MPDAAAKSIEISGGRKVLIRRLSRSRIDRSTRDLSLAARLVRGGVGVRASWPETAAAAVEKVLLLGLVQPKLVADPAEGPTPSDFEWPDQLTIFSGILSLTGGPKFAACLQDQDPVGALRIFLAAHRGRAYRKTRRG
jgi:hypothetical protein